MGIRSPSVFDTRLWQGLPDFVAPPKTWFIAIHLSVFNLKATWISCNTHPPAYELVGNSGLFQLCLIPAPVTTQEAGALWSLSLSLISYYDPTANVKHTLFLPQISSDSTFHSEQITDSKAKTINATLRNKMKFKRCSSSALFLDLWEGAVKGYYLLKLIDQKELIRNGLINKLPFLLLGAFCRVRCWS